MLVFLIILLGSSTIQRTDALCPSGWESIGHGCYKYLGDAKFTYSEAVSRCSSIGGTLFVPNSNDELHAVTRARNPYPYWVGCTYEAMEGTFPCEDGTQLDVNSTWWATSWAPITRPPNTTNSCLFYSYNYSGLVKVHCHLTGETLCEAKPKTTPNKSAGFFSIAKDNDGRPLIGHCLTDHVIKTVPAKTKLRCAAECIHEAGCKSINYKDGVCELNEETRASVLSSYFSQYDGCSYYELI
ncbi:uncharacterized protein LOC115922384 [Strongylocentrotus purpuratus]|uniref:C-type lectin domain-containing protein n=1 Tax=Strongylocentrotus purpuratus TaxID=7668 RepID=A0A7M7SWV1_STRPU|nr:uncharacterized protein LOC115922384 [Strongylocentrotus purpuratus]|eukprot:XP_011665602.1 PREDICTED: uncharacterized protein LOC105438923 [Strongylocentrotus purpuratus]